MDNGIEARSLFANALRNMGREALALGVEDGSDKSGSTVAALQAISSVLTTRDSWCSAYAELRDNPQILS